MKLKMITARVWKIWHMNYQGYPSNGSTDTDERYFVLQLMCPLCEL